MGKGASTKPLAMLLVISALALCLMQLPAKAAAAVSITDKTFSFLQSVVGLDLSKYAIQSSVGPIIDHPNDLDGLSRTTGELTLVSGSSRLEVIYNYVNDSIVACDIDVRQGSMILTQNPPTEARLMVKDFLQKYGNFTGDSSTATMSVLVDSVDPAKDSVSALNNLVLETSTLAGSSIFKWKVAYNGAVFSYMTLTLDNGTFASLFDDRSYVQIGSTDVNVSKDQAVQIALNSTRVPAWGTIFVEGIQASLGTKGRNDRSQLVLYPYWIVNMPLLGTDSNGWGGSLEVQIWADTGQLITSYFLGIDYIVGSNSSEEPINAASPSPSSSLSASPSPSPTPTSPTQAPSPSPTPTPTLTPIPTPTPSPSPTQQPTLEPSQTPDRPKIGDFAPVLIPATMILIGIVAIGLLVYLSKRKGMSK